MLNKTKQKLCTQRGKSRIRDEVAWEEGQPMISQFEKLRAIVLIFKGHCETRNAVLEAVHSPSIFIILNS